MEPIPRDSRDSQIEKHSSKDDFSPVSTKLRKRSSEQIGNDASGQASTTIAEIQARLEDCQEKLAAANNARQILEQQMKDKLIIDLSAPIEDTISVLQGEIHKLQPYGPVKGSRSVGRGSMDTSVNDDGQTSFKGTVDAQRILISRLETDLVSARADAEQFKAKYEKQKKRSRVSSAKQKADAQVQALRLKEKLDSVTEKYEASLREIDDLKKRNSELVTSDEQDRNTRVSSETKENCADDGDDDDNPHAALVLSLSSQISALDEELQAAHEEIARLKKSAD